MPEVVLCECGCDRPTLPYATNDKRIGAVKGQPARIIRGHNYKGDLKPLKETRVCKGCGIEKARNDENFNRDKSHRDGLATRCKECAYRTNRKWVGTKAYQAKYRIENKDRVRAQIKEWREKNHERSLAAVREWAIKNPDRVRDWHAEYRVKNPDKIRANAVNTKARRRTQMEGMARVTADDLRGIYEKCGGICHICDSPVAFDRATWDHVTPLAKGGPHEIGNLLPAHGSCNCIKNSGSLESARKRIADRRAARTWEELD